MKFAKQLTKMVDAGLGEEVKPPRSGVAVGNEMAVIDSLIDDVEELREDVTGLQSDVTNLQSDVTDLQAADADLKKDLEAVEDVSLLPIDVKWTQGSIGNTGEDSPATNRCRSGYITVRKGESLNVNHGSLWFFYKKYTTTGVYIGESSYSATWRKSDDVITDETGDYMYRLIVRNAAGTTITASDVDVTLTKGTILYGLMDKLQPIVNTPMRCILPNKLYVCGGIQIDIYYQNILQYGNVETIPLIKPKAFLSSFNRFARMKYRADASESHGTRFEVYLSNTKDFTFESDALSWTVIPNTAGSGLSKSVLIIGDSLTEQHDAIANDLETMFADDAMNVTFIGTQGSGTAKHEGRSGWSAEIYTNNATYDGKTNPFWNPGTSEFDFSYYMTQNNFSGVDYVLIDMGSNSIDSDPEDIIEAYDTMIDSIRAYDSDIRIGIWLPPVRAVTEFQSTLKRGNQSLEVNRILIEEYDKREAEKLYVIPVYFNLDPYHDYKFVTVQVSERNTMTVQTVEDFLHPALVGFQKLADVLFGYIKYFGQLDESDTLNQNMRR